MVLYQRSIERLERSRLELALQLRSAQNTANDSAVGSTANDNAVDSPLDAEIAAPVIRHIRSGSDTSAIKVLPNVKPKANRSKYTI